ncbi:hypothetical protein EXIGLDRAFT_439105 [Exidia glandulosa HHB12029]|uniref:Replication factor A C-terminal domain-containing protein n=1 Tax=Exidia glandulosa HHB12029 TaxID=1314781 RepID=A0A165KEB1_EXIGL|nr:hypothetical protein EXIGLDRAFT_439105 [Exidia glandulosa HHB12029]
MSADELQKDDSELDTVFKNAVGKTFLVSCRVKQDTYNDEPRMRYSISKIQPVDYCTEAEALAQLIASYPKE